MDDGTQPVRLRKLRGALRTYATLTERGHSQGSALQLTAELHELTATEYVTLGVAVLP